MTEHKPADRCFHMGCRPFTFALVPGIGAEVNALVLQFTSPGHFPVSRVDKR